jgi:hypothetical protein
LNVPSEKLSVTAPARTNRRAARSVNRNLKVAALSRHPARERLRAYSPQRLGDDCSCACVQSASGLFQPELVGRRRGFRRLFRPVRRNPSRAARFSPSKDKSQCTSGS